MSKPNIEIGAVAPDFTLETINRESWTLSEHLGKVVALLFYPKDETLVCTKQLCSVRDNWDDYVKTKAVIVGISPGTVEEHAQFAQHHRLPIQLLADSDSKVTDLYIRKGWLPVWFMRAIVVIDAKGIIRSHTQMLRARRPSDYAVISQIYSAQTDRHIDKYHELLSQHRIKK